LKNYFGAQVNLFLAEDIPLGSNWFENIRTALAQADLILALFSPHSMKRPWINIEAGYGIMANKNVIPICFLGLQKSNLPVVYWLQQAMHLEDLSEVGRLLDGIASTTSAKTLQVDKATTLQSWRTSMSAALSELFGSGFLIHVNIESEHHFHIANKASGGCLDIEDWGKTDGACIIQYPYHGGDNQLWQISVVDSFYTIISKHSQKCLEVKDSSAEEGATIVQRDYEGYMNQQWDFTMLQDGAYKIAARHSGKVLSIQESNQSSRCVVQTCWHDLPVQRWWLKVNVTPIQPTRKFEWHGERHARY
jgi:hypothetical protein